MDITPYVDSLRDALAAAAAPGGDEARALADRLAGALDSAARLSLLEALSAAADEITQELAPGSVEVRLRGRDPDFIVTSPPSEESDEDGAAPVPVRLAAPEPAFGDGDEIRTARITLRVPEHLKPRVEAAAEQAGLSVNAWLVRAVAIALDAPAEGRSSSRGGQRYSGWLR
jgi:hypothetical protein